MKAIILAAGVGSRLAPLTTKQPKGLVEVRGEPILSWQIESLLASNIKNITLCVGYKSKQVMDFCRARYPHVRFNFITNKNYLTTNNMYSLYLARHELTGDIFLMNGDVVFDKNILIGMKKAPGSLFATDKDNYLEESMKITVGKKSEVLDISKKISKENAYGVSIDIYRFSKHDTPSLREGLIDIVAKEKNINQWTEVLLQKLLASQKIHVKPYDIKNNRWYEIDTLSDLRQAELIFNDELTKARRKKIIFVDKDGTLTIGGKVIPGSVEFINHLVKKKYKFFILTNNSSKTKTEHAEQLKSIGMKIHESNILLSTDCLMDYLRKKRTSDIHLLANKKVKQYFLSRGFILDSKNPKAVVLTYDNELNYKKLIAATKLIQGGMPYFATHIDTLCPMPWGPVPDIGTFIKVIEMTTGRLPDKHFGKPSKTILEPALEKYKVAPSECVMIGDRIYTDIAMAKKNKMLSILTLSGETKEADLEKSNIKPDIIVESVDKLIEFL